MTTDGAALAGMSPAFPHSTPSANAFPVTLHQQQQCHYQPTLQPAPHTLPPTPLQSLYEKISEKESQPNSSPYSHRPPAARRAPTQGGIPEDAVMEEEEEEEEAQEEEEGDTQASSAMDGTRMSTRYQPVHAEL